MKTLVIGLGNPILTDDGVGVLVARAVERSLAAEPGGGSVDVTEASVGGLRLMELMAGYERVILIDAWMAGGDRPGSVHRWTLDDLRRVSPSQHLASAHDTTLPTALEAGRRLGVSLPADVVIFAITTQDVVNFGDRPTPAVAAAVPLAAAAIVAELR